MHGILRTAFVACLWAAGIAATAADGPRDVPPPETFAGFGLAGFEGEGSIAAALRRAGDGRAEPDESQQILPGLELRGLSVQGPNQRDLHSPIAAEVRSRIDRFDVAAGVRTEQDRVTEGPSQWVGRIGLSNDRPEGSERLELRTTLGRRSEGGMLGIEVGPRLERRLRRGTTFFIDGKAEAQAARSAEGGWWSMPGTATDGASMVGVGARTGLVR
jgi:hypothetical protein